MATPGTPYESRLVDAELQDLLGAAAAVLIEGPKASGKTATARQAAASEVFFDIDSVARQAASLDPQLVIEGAAPRLLDEWQLVPEHLESRPASGRPRTGDGQVHPDRFGGPDG